MTALLVKSLRHVVGLAALAGLIVGFSGCGKQKGGGDGDAKVAPSAAPSGSAARGPAGPCGEYATRICKAAGEDSPTCHSINTAAELLPPASCSAALKEVDYSLAQLAKQRKSCDELVSKLCTEFGPATQICALVKSQTKEFPPERCKMMLAHLSEVIADLRQMEAANKPLDAEQRAAIEKGSAPAFGPENAKVTIVEFSDFQCPYCVQASKTVARIKERYPKDVRFVFRQFPLSIHPQAHQAAQAALAAHAQGKFWEYHDRLFQNPANLDRATLEEHARQIGLNMAAFQKALDEKTYAPAVDADLALGEKVKVAGTPTMFVNGERVAAPGDFEAVAAQIDAALKAAG